MRHILEMIVCSFRLDEPPPRAFKLRARQPDPVHDRNLKRELRKLQRERFKVASKSLGLLVFLLCGCGASSPSWKPTDAVELCAQTLALSNDFRREASSMGREPLDLAREGCRLLAVGVELVQATIPRTCPVGIAGAAGSASAPIAGAAGGG